MEKRKLKAVADEGSIVASIDDSLIAVVEFKIKGVPFKGQFSPDIDGIYAFDCLNMDKLADVLTGNTTQEKDNE